MGLDELTERLDTVLDQMYSSRTPLADQDALRGEFLDVYDTLLQQLLDTGTVLNEDHAYFFSIPQFRAYRNLLGDDVLSFIGAGAVYTLPAGSVCEPEHIKALKQRLESLQ